MKIRTEPVLVGQAITNVGALLVLFGVPLTAKQIAGIVIAYGSVAALFIRSKVTPQR